MTSPRARFLAAALALVAAVFAVYAPVARHEWIAYDDDVYLVDNPHVAKGLDPAEIRWVFGHAYAGNYHPLTWLSHMLDVELFGLEPGPHQLVNVGLHALNAVLVLALLRALLGSLAAAALGAALFALHPLRVESVAWASERKDVLCAALFLGGLLAYLRYARAPSAARYGIVCALLALALLAKPMAVTFPLVVLLLDAWPLRRAAHGDAAARRRLVLEKRPLLALAALGALATLWAQSEAGATSSLGGLSLGLRALNALATVGTYVRQSLLPAGLSVYYPHAAHLSEEPARALLLPALGGLATLAALLALAWRARRSAPAAAVGVGFFLVTLAPVIGLVQVGTQAHADRYTYLPSVGLAAAAAALALRLPPRPARAAGALGLVAALALGALARHRVGAWRDTRTLFERALAVEPRNFLAHSKLGEVAMAEGDEPRARAAFERTLELQPNHVESLNNLGLCHLARGEPELALAPLERALALGPDDAQTWLNLGAVELELGEHASARLRFERALELDPASADAHYDLGVLAKREGDGAEAERRFERALELDPAHADAWSNLGQARLAASGAARAVEAFERAAELEPDDAYLHFNLGVARRAAGDRAGATRSFERALELEPGLAPARAALRALAEGRP